MKFDVESIKEILLEDPKMRRLTDVDFEAIADICQKVEFPDNIGGQHIVEASLDHILNATDYYLKGEVI